MNSSFAVLLNVTMQFIPLVKAIALDIRPPFSAGAPDPDLPAEEPAIWFGDDHKPPPYP